MGLAKMICCIGYLSLDIIENWPATIDDELKFLILMTYCPSSSYKFSRHKGQVYYFFNHSLKQREWNICLQGVYLHCYDSSGSKHTMHSSSFAGATI